MSKFTATSSLAVFASLLAAHVISLSIAHASDNCLASPNSPTPPGSHWYYRTDHTSQRDCWYLRDSHAGPAQSAPANAQSAPPNVLPPSNPISPPALTTTTDQLADAHAELPAPTPEPTPEPPQSRDNETAPATASETGANENSGAPKLAADPGHRPILMAALALAGIIGSVIFKLGSPLRSRRARSRKRRGAIWASADRGRRIASAYPAVDDFAVQPDFARDLDRANEQRARERGTLSQPSKRSRSRS